MTSSNSKMNGSLTILADQKKLVSCFLTYFVLKQYEKETKLKMEKLWITDVYDYLKRFTKPQMNSIWWLLSQKDRFNIILKSLMTRKSKLLTEDKIYLEIARCISTVSSPMTWESSWISIGPMLITQYLPLTQLSMTFQSMLISKK